jgi:RNA polymerase primary sigma factor
MVGAYHKVGGGRFLDVYLCEIRKYPLLTREEEGGLSRRIKTGDITAVKELVNANLRFVVSIAKKYREQGVPFEDLIGYGNIGLLKAANRFDEKKGSKFIYYAVKWIGPSMLEAIATHSTNIRVPRNRTTQKVMVKRELRKRMQLPCARMSEGAMLYSVFDYLKFTNEDQEAYFAANDVDCELDIDDSGEEEDSSPTLDRLDLSVEQDNGIWDLGSHDLVVGALNSITPRERKILNLYYGLDGNEPISLEKIGARVKLTRERIRQIRNEAFEKIRGSTAGKNLADHLAA